MTDDSGAITEFGFRWGPITVQRTATLPDGTRVLTIRTAFTETDLYVSPKGRTIRAFGPYRPPVLKGQAPVVKELKS